jgi:hypothetical protein
VPRSGYYSRRTQAITGVIVHNTGGDESLERDNEYHRFEADWGDGLHAPHIAYHIWVGRDGRVVLCNYLWEASWHARYANESCVGIAFQGDGEESPLSREQLSRLRWLVETYLPTQGVTVPWSSVWGHGECPNAWGGGPDWGNNTVCPGRMVLPQIKALRSGE